MFRPTLCSSKRALLHRQIRAGCSRTLFSLPNLSNLAPWNESEPERYHERKILPYGQVELYNVVADVASYHRFIPFCTGSRIVTPPRQVQTFGRYTPSVEVMEAELTVGFLAFTEKYVSKVTCKAHESVEAVASTSTPLFKTLTTTWRFQPISPQSSHLIEPSNANGTIQPRKESTLVTLDLVYAFANPIHATISSKFFGQVSKLMVQAFEDRCRSVYGNRGG